jgi:hypothetical protein
LKVQFEDPFISVFDPIQFCLKFELNSPMNLEFKNLKISFSDKQYDIVRMEKFTLSNKKSNEFKFPISIKDKMDLKCLDVSIELVPNTDQELIFFEGDQESFGVIFKWVMSENEYYTTFLNDYDFRNEVGQGLFVERPVIRVNQPKPNLKLQFEHLPPALLNENYGIRIILNSNEDSILNGKIRFEKIEDISIKDENCENLISELKFEKIEQQTKKEFLIFMKSKVKGQHKIMFIIEYQTTKFPNLIKEEHLDVYVDVPFNSLFQYVSTREKNESELFLVPCFTKSFLHKTTTKSESFLELKNDLKKKELGLKFIQQDAFPKNNSILLSTKLTCKTPFELNIVDSNLILNSSFESQKKEFNFKKSIKNLDHFTIIDLIEPLKDDLQPQSVGSIQIKYRRVKTLQSSNVSNATDILLEIPLPSIKIIDQKYFISFCKIMHL